MLLWFLFSSIHLPASSRICLKCHPVMLKRQCAWTHHRSLVAVCTPYRNNVAFKNVTIVAGVAVSWTYGPSLPSFLLIFSLLFIGSKDCTVGAETQRIEMRSCTRNSMGGDHQEPLRRGKDNDNWWMDL